MFDRLRAVRTSVFLFFLCCAPVIYFLAALRHAFGVSTDEALYVLLSNAVRHGEFGFPGRFGYPVTDPLPGYPLILSIPAWLLGPHWDRFWIVGLLPSLAVLWMTWRLSSEVLERREAMLATGLTALNVQLLDHAGFALPDTAFLACSLGLFLACSREKARRWIPLSSAAAGVAALMRPQGAFLILSLSALVGLRQGWKRGAAFAALAYLPLGGWMLRNHWAAGTMTGYADNWKTQVVAMAEAGGQWRHVMRMISVLYGNGILAWGHASKAVQFAGGCAILLTAGFGTYCILRRSEQPLVFSIACYGILITALHATWPPLTERYAIAVVPFVWILAVPALSWASQRKAVVLGTFAFACGLMSIRQDVSIAVGPFPKSIDQPGTIAWIRENTAPSAGFESLTPAEIKLVTGRDTIWPTAYGSRDAWINSLLTNNVEYIHFISFAPDGLLPQPTIDFVRQEMSWVQSSPYFTRVYLSRSEGTAVFRFRHPDPPRFAKAWAALTLGVAANQSGRHQRLVRRKLLEAESLEPTLAIGWKILGMMEKDPGLRKSYFEKAQKADPTLRG